MKSSAIISALAAVSLSIASLSAGAQGMVRDRNASNNPEIYRQTHPEDTRRQPDLQGGRNDRDNRAPAVENRNWGARSNDRNEATRRYDEERDHGRRYDNRAYNGYRDYGRRDGGNFYYGARSPEFRRGGYIPYEYRNRQYWVNDWRGHHLSAPPRGYQWVQVGADYALIAVATGLIANLILNQ
jgi:Ni/Co efflux regulator RcnB